MAALNKVMVIGRVGRDPAVRMAGSSKVVDFSLAATEKFNDRNGNKQEKTEWVNVVIWGKLADVVEQYVRKGSELYVEGKLETQSWDDKDGNKKYKTVVNCFSMQMLGGNEHRQREENNNQQGHSPQQQNQHFNQAPEVAIDDLPF